MSTPIKNVVLVGASGNLGPSVLKEFLESSLNVTVLTRPGSKATYPPNVKTVQTEYTHDALASVFKSASTDAVVSLVGDASVQTPLIDAAITAGVKRFFPTEYGCNTSNPNVIKTVPLLAPKRRTAEYLETKQDSISWTSLITGPFFDWGLNTGFLGYNIADATVHRWDGGETRWSTTNMRTIGRALVALLTKPEAYDASANGYVFIESHQVTQNKVQAALEKATGKKFTVVEEIDGEQRLKAAHEALAKGDLSGFGDLLVGATVGKSTSYGLWESTWNERLGLQDKSLDEDVEDLVKALKG